MVMELMTCLGHPVISVSEPVRLDRVTHWNCTVSVLAQQAPLCLRERVFGGTAPTESTVSISIGGVPAKVLFSGITAAGEYQFNIIVPNVSSGDQVLQAIVGGVQTQSNISISIQ